MNDGTGFTAPEIADTAIPWVCGVLGLPATAFSGPDGQDPRLTVLKSLATLDIEACPGSGKTTLLVAKYDYEIGRADPQPQTFVQYDSYLNKIGGEGGIRTLGTG